MDAAAGSHWLQRQLAPSHSRSSDTKLLPAQVKHWLAFSASYTLLPDTGQAREVKGRNI